MQSQLEITSRLGDNNPLDSNNKDAPPGVYTETKLDPAVVGLLGNIRIPALLGTSEEVKYLDAYELARGSSATIDQKKANEDVSSQFDGINRICTVSQYPIVTGDGSGTPTININDVTVKVNDVAILVAAVDGLDGKIALAIAPKNSDQVTVTYFYKKTDTQVTEDVSDQVDGSTLTFFTDHVPVVDGTNAGRTTTNVNNVQVKVNGVVTGVTRIDGANGAVTLVAAPAISDTVTIKYWYNSHANTSDDLPELGLIRISRVGLSPETSDFIESVDFAIINNQIQWGTGTTLVIATHTTGTEFFDDTQITTQVIDDEIYNENVSSQVAGATPSVLCTTRFKPIVDGTGRDITTYDSSKVVVKVNGSAVAVRKVDGENGVITLFTAPTTGDTVEVTYWRSRMEDDTYAVEVIVPGTTGVGTYKITSIEDGRLGIAVPGTENVASASFTGAIYTTGPTVSKGFTLNETVRMTFTDNEHFAVTSTDPVGSTGTGKTDRTYVDARTGLVFTLQSDVEYASGDWIEINVTAEATFTTSVIPTTSVPGVRVTVNNTINCGVADVTNLVAFDKSGKEPAVGDTYYISYSYLRTNYDCGLYTKFKDITNEYGPLAYNNALVLASYLCFQNGSIALILCQAKKATGSDEAADQTYMDILTRLGYPVDGYDPSVIVPLTSSETVIQAISTHVTQQSSKRARKERVAFFGYAVGTEATEAGAFAQAIRNSRMVALYPDGAQMQLVNPDGSTSDFVVDGAYIAAAFAGLNVSTAYDVATPMTRKALTGFTKLVREMDEVTMDMLATKGVTIVAGRNPFYIRHCLTTNMDSILTRELNVVTVGDFIQQETRRVLDKFIGNKFTAAVVGDVTAVLKAMLQAAKDLNLIVDFSGITASRDPNQPDFIRASAFYVPIVGVNYIEVVYNIRVRT